MLEKPNIGFSTLTKPNGSNIEFSGVPLSDSETSAIYSLAKQSTHPLSFAIVNHYKDAGYHQPEHFVEVSGWGIFGKVNNLDIKIGSDEYVTKTSIAKVLNWY